MAAATKNQNRKKLLAIRTIFIGAWLFFSGIIFLIAILSDINWTRPNLEDFIGQSLHRNVKLGRLYWHFGFKGLAVQTSRLLVAEHSGDPFLMAGNCEIGFQFRPLLLGRGEIHHFDLQNPLFMAVRTGKGSWNFDDLLVACPEVDFIDCHHGHVFVIDRKPINSGNRFPDTELNDVEIKLHRAGHFTPAQERISFLLPSEKNNPVRFSFAGYLWGKDKQWQQRNCRFHIDCQHFSLQNWQALFAVISADKQTPTWSNLVFSPLLDVTHTALGNKLTQAFVKGNFDVNADADGVPSTKLKVDLKVKAYNLVYVKANKIAASLPDISTAAQLALEANSLKLNKLSVHVPDDNMLINCNGQLTGINDRRGLQTQAEVVALWRDLSKLNSFINFFDSIMPDNAVISSIKSLPVGKLFIDLKFFKNNQNTTYDLEATAADCKISTIITWLHSAGQHNKTPLRNALARLLQERFAEDSLEELCLSQQAKFAGTIFFKSNGELNLKDCSLEDGSVVWKFSGNADQLGNWTKLELSNKDLPLAKLSTALGDNQRLDNRVKEWLGLKANCQIALSGKAQVTAKLNQAVKKSSGNKNNYFTCEAVLNDADLHLSQPAVNIHHLSGSYVAGIDQLILKNIHGNTASGAITIDASLPINNNQPLNFNLHADSISVPDLLSLLQLFHMDTTNLNHWQLGGKLKELALSISGSTSKPLLRLTAIPDDIIFALPNSQSIMHANSGKIVYSNDSLILDRLNMNSQNSNFLISLTIKNPSTTASLEKLSVDINSIDLSDLQAAIPAATIPTYFKNLFANIGAQYQINSLKGKISGNLEYERRGEQNLHGNVELDNISLRCGQRQLFCHNLKGKIIFAGNDLLCRGITGNINNSSFSMEGRLINYQNKSPQWRGEATVQIAPADLNDALSLLVSTGQASAIKSKSKKTIIVKIKSNLAQNTLTHTFTLLVDADAGLAISSNSFSFQQPSSTKLVISGSCHKDDQQWLWNYLSFDFAGNQIIFKGSVRNNGQAYVANLVAQISEFMQASLLEQSFCPDLIAGTVNGQIKGTLNLQGPLDSLQIGGKIHLSDLSIPSVYLSHITGELSLQPAGPSGEQPTWQASMHLKELDLGMVLLSKASGTITYSPSGWVLKDFGAQLAGGKLTANGKADLKQKKFNLELTVKGSDLAELWPQITNSQIDADGPFDCHFVLESTGTTVSDIEENMAGSGTIHVGQGSFNRTGQLHARLNQVNLLHQGIFGFNVNNLMQSVLPAKTSGFYSIDGSFGLSSEVLTIRSFLYDSKDLRFSAAGKANLALHSLELDVAGVMPRVSTSVIHGPIGQLSREITLQKLLDSVTMHKLEKLPSLPLLGSIGAKSDLFTCRIAAPYNQPKLISQSIQKSFQWLNYRAANVSTKHVQ